MPPKRRTTARKLATSTRNAEPPKVVNPTNTNAGTTSGLTQEAEDQFELELCWCIQELETCLASGKLSKKQAHDQSKSINILKSNTAPLVKKRQVMRNTLGNYREKMSLDELKLGKTVSSMRFISAPTQNKKCVFVRKAACKSIKEKQCLDSDEAFLNSKENPIDIENVQTVFKFNFHIAE